MNAVLGTSSSLDIAHNGSPRTFLYGALALCEQGDSL